MKNFKSKLKIRHEWDNHHAIYVEFMWTIWFVIIFYFFYFTFVVKIYIFLILIYIQFNNPSIMILIKPKFGSSLKFFNLSFNYIAKSYNISGFAIKSLFILCFT